jgi:serine/threonine-protein kinase HipA
MNLAHRAGLDVAPVRLVNALGKDVLLIERFDRVRVATGWVRKSMVSALTVLGLSEMHARYASYEDFAHRIRARFVAPKQTLHELFGRLVFNVLCGNTDDHARNHAAFWDGRSLSLTPAYDICPQNRAGNEATQAMLIVGNNRFSQLKTCLQAAHLFLLSDKEAADIIDRVETTIRDNWSSVCEEARLTSVDKALMWHRQFLNPFSIER